MLPNPLFWNVHMYGVMIAVGILCCFLVLTFYTKIKKADQKFMDFVFFNGIAAIFIGFVFATLFQSTYNFIANPAAGFKIGSGMTFIGGLIGGVACFLLGYFIFRKKFETRLYQVVSMTPCAILIAHAWGRIGCFFAGCCYGKETDLFLGVTFPGMDHAVHPTQLYEAAFLFIMFGVCTYLYLKHDYQHNLSLYLFTYGIFRFLIEYLRGDNRGELVSFVSPSQFWSILMVAASFGVYFYMRHLLKKEKEQKEAK